jgi:hypothetical protein
MTGRGVTGGCGLKELLFIEGNRTLDKEQERLREGRRRGLSPPGGDCKRKDREKEQDTARCVPGRCVCASCAPPWRRKPLSQVLFDCRRYVSAKRWIWLVALVPDCKAERCCAERDKDGAESDPKPETPDAPFHRCN